MGSTFRNLSDFVPIELVETDLLETAPRPLEASTSTYEILTIAGDPIGLRCTPDLRRFLPHHSLATIVAATVYNLTYHGLKAEPLAKRWTISEIVRRTTALTCTSNGRSSLSIAVCSLGTRSQVWSTLRSLIQNTSQCKILFVHNQAYSEECRKSIESLDSRIRYINEPKAGLNRARNMALRSCGTDVLAYIDDDVEVMPGWERALADHFESDPDLACLTGLVLPCSLSTGAEALFESYGSFSRGVGRFWWEDQLRSKGGGPLRMAPWNVGTGANMAFRTKLLEAIGGFDPSLEVGTPVGGAGDLDAFFRLQNAGRTIVYEPSFFVKHRHRTDVAALRRQIKAFGAFACMLQAHFESNPADRRFLPSITREWLKYFWMRICSALFSGEYPIELVYDEFVGYLTAICLRKFANSVSLCSNDERLNLLRPSIALKNSAMERVESSVDLSLGLGSLHLGPGPRRAVLHVKLRDSLIGSFSVSTSTGDLSSSRLRHCIASFCSRQLLRDFEGDTEPERCLAQLRMFKHA